MIWSVDGTDWEIPCTVEREAELSSSEISGMLLDKSYFNDVVGTYMKYSVRLAVPFGWEQEYAELYDILTDPVAGHDFVLPYSGGTVELNARIEAIKDVYVKMPDGIHWKGITFDIISNHPTRTYTLEEAINMGFPPLPDESDVVVGETYTYTSEGWSTMESAEDTLY